MPQKTGSDNAGRWVESLQKERIVLEVLLCSLYYEFVEFNIKLKVKGFGLLLDRLRG